MAKTNPGFKNANEQSEFTSEQIIELQKCSQDVVYFVENYVKIRHPVRGAVNFTLFDYQKKMLNSFAYNRNTILLSARQSGKSIVSASFLLWFANFNFDKDVVVASNKNANAMEMIRRIRFAYENLPNWLKAGIEPDGWNKHSIKFDNGSRIESFATTAETARGMSVSLMFIDEMAFVKPNIQEEFWTSISPTLATGGSCIISSTPNNSNDVFATLWQGAELNSNDFIPIRVHWTETPGRSDDFKQKEISKIGLEKWEREFELKFLSADDLLINPITLQNLTEKVKHIEPVKEIKGIKFWKVPDEKDNNITTFIVSVDPASGRGGDYCVFEVFTFPSLEQVAEYRTNDVPTTELYKILKLLLGFLEKHSANVYFSIESNAIGEGLIALYENDEESPEKSEFISGNRKTPGFYTTRKDKNRFCYTLKDMVESNKIDIKSKTLVSELKNFISSRGSYEARVGSTDDCISAVLIGLRIMNEMTTYDDRAFDKIYGGLNVDHWTEKDMLTYNEEDDDILPIIGDGDEYASYKPLEFYH